MESVLKSLRFALPLLLVVATAVLQIRAKQLGLPLLLAAAGGGLLGYALAFAVESVALLVGRPAMAPACFDRRLVQLEREKETVLRSIKEIEFDAALGKIEADEATLLMEPLRQRALSVLRDLDRARLVHPLTVEEQIEEELARRASPRAAEPPGDAR